MAWDMGDIRTALADRLSYVDGLRVYPYLPGQVQPPCAVIVTGEPWIERGQAMGRGLATIRLIVDVLVSASNIEQAQRTVDRLVREVPDAILEDKTLNGEVSDIRISDVDGVQSFTVEGSDYLGFGVPLELLVNDSSS